MQINSSNMMEEIKNLGINENIYLDCPKEMGEEVKSAVIINSANNELMENYIDISNEEMYPDHAQEFLKKYQESYENEFTKVRECVTKLCGIDIAKLLYNCEKRGKMNKYYFYIDWNIRKLIIGCNF